MTIISAASTRTHTHTHAVQWATAHKKVWNAEKLHDLVGSFEQNVLEIFAQIEILQILK